MSEEKSEEVVNEMQQTEEQNPIQTMEDLAERQRLESEAIAKKYDELYDQLVEGGYFKEGYSDDSVVQVPGKLFGEFVNFVSAQMQTLHSVGGSIQILHNTNEALITNLSHMTIRLMEQHKTNVDTGATTPFEEMDKEDAKKNIKLAKETPKKATKKATGTTKD